MKTISTKNIFQNSWINVHLDSVDLGRGSCKDVAVVDIVPGVVVLPIDRENNVILVREYRYAVKKFTEEAVNGGIKSGESPFAAAKRELIEETGLISENWSSLGKVEPGTSFVRAPIHLYVAEGLEKTPDYCRLVGESRLTTMKLSNFVADILSINIDHALTGLVGLMYWFGANQ